jgi:REP element-mobilizing transposase RayT
MVPLFQLTNAYDTVYKWFDHVNSNNIYVLGYVIMPNHMHVLLYFPKMEKPLNTMVGNCKRFMAYEIIKRLEKSKEEAVLERLHSGVKKREKRKDRYTRSLKIVLMQRSVIQRNLFIKSFSICILIPLVRNGAW